jgi:CheY-like chemotaxis protein/anti-sigma regulatory factor (Ser/Thr protein kinase)
LFSELLDLSRLDAGHVQLQRRHVPFSYIVERLRARYFPLAEAKELTLSMDANAATVYSDPVLLERLLGNLIANAIQYTEHGTVRLDTSVGGGVVVVSVCDTGIGIAEEYRARIFEEFFQVGNPERDRRKGLGLGLAIVQRISSMLAHPLTLQSEVGHGSCFTLSVPCGDPARIEPEAAPPDTPMDVLSGKTILVVDDEASVLQGMRELLTRWGCEVLPAAEAATAVELARNRHPPDLIVADLRLRRGSSGVEAIESVRSALGRVIPALIITGDTSVAALQQARLSGCPVLHKPVRPVKLRAALSQLLVAADAAEETA